MPNLLTLLVSQRQTDGRLTAGQQSRARGENRFRIERQQFPVGCVTTCSGTFGQFLLLPLRQRIDTRINGDAVTFDLTRKQAWESS